MAPPATRRPQNPRIPERNPQRARLRANPSGPSLGAHSRDRNTRPRLRPPDRRGRRYRNTLHPRTHHPVTFRPATRLPHTRRWRARHRQSSPPRSSPPPPTPSLGRSRQCRNTRHPVIPRRGSRPTLRLGTSLLPRGMSRTSHPPIHHPGISHPATRLRDTRLVTPLRDMGTATATRRTRDRSTPSGARWRNGGAASSPICWTR